MTISRIIILRLLQEKQNDNSNHSFIINSVRALHRLQIRGREKMNQSIERYEIIKTPTHRVYVRDSLLNCDSILYESSELAQEAIKKDDLDFDFELME